VSGAFSFKGTMQQTTLFTHINEAQKILDVRLEKHEKSYNSLLATLYSTRIEDQLVPHTDIMFLENDPFIECVLSKEDTAQQYRVHRHAFGQMCSKVKFPLSYNDFLNGHGKWGMRLSCENLNTLFTETEFKRQNNAPAKFLVRRVGPYIRGFLSRRYGLHLSTLPLLERFADYCAEQQAMPAEVVSSDVRVHVLSVQRHLYQPFPGQFFAMGMAFFNSDYGAGTFSTYPCLIDPIKNFSMVLSDLDMAALIDEKLFKKIHLGPMLSEEDLNPTNSARAKRTDDVSKAMRETVSKRVTASACETICKAIAKAKDTTVPWPRVHKALAKVLLEEELKQMSDFLLNKHHKLPKLDLDADGLPIPTNWWVSQAISEVALNTIDPDRIIDLQQEAGRFITKEI
jgi:hypothetical protein